MICLYTYDLRKTLRLIDWAHCTDVDVINNWLVKCVKVRRASEQKQIRPLDDSACCALSAFTHLGLWRKLYDYSLHSHPILYWHFRIRFNFLRYECIDWLSLTIPTAFSQRATLIRLYWHYWECFRKFRLGFQLPQLSVRPTLHKLFTTWCTPTALDMLPLGLNQERLLFEHIAFSSNLTVWGRSCLKVPQSH